MTASIELQQVKKSYDRFEVIKGIDLNIEEGEFIIFVGPSGCGKSTLLRMIAGLEDITEGDILIKGQNVTADPPSKRGLAMVFQSYALYPHMNVRDNMGFSLKTAGAPQAEIDQKVSDVAEALKLEALLERLPKELSGGQRQRVAIGRSIVRDPTAFLFDEPLSNLDAALRVEMRYEIAKLHQRLKATMIYVTHDQVEAMTLADRIVVLQAGQIEQIGTPRELYQKPANLFVAQFMGSPKMNILPVQHQDGDILLAGQKIMRQVADQGIDKIGIRPEDILLSDIDQTHQPACQGQIDVVEYLGSDLFLIIDCGPKIGHLTVRSGPDAGYQVGQSIALNFKQEALHLFDRTGCRVTI